MPEYRIFLLSPASSRGRRADILMSERATFDLALRFRDGGAPLGEVFSFLSGLYFRGKLAYANHFVRPLPESAGVFIITPNRGLLSGETMIIAEDLKSFGGVPIDVSESSYLEPLQQSARKLSNELPADSEVVLLGSISTGKYVDPLLEIFQSRLRFPQEFVGRGDMSRGGLMLRCVDSGEELQYAPLQDAIRHGKRPPKLQPRRKVT